MTIQISLKQPAERTFIIFRQEADFLGEPIPGGGINNGESTTLPIHVVAVVARGRPTNITDRRTHTDLNTFIT